MKKELSIIVLSLIMMSTFVARGQQLVIGSKVPEFKGVEWKTSAPVSGKPMYVEFYQSTNATSQKLFPKLKNVKDTNREISIVVLMREDNDATRALITEFGASYSFGYDPQGKIYDALGVRFVPFSMVIDAKGNLYWQGNLSNLSNETIKQVK